MVHAGRHLPYCRNHCGACLLRFIVLQGLLRGVEGLPGLGGDRSLAGAGQEGQVVQPFPAGSMGSRNRRVPKRVPLYVRLY